MPLSMVDPRSTKPNKHFLQIFWRFWTSMCTCLQSNPGILRSFVCLQRIQYVQTGSLFLLLQSQRCAMQSTSLNTICNCCTSFTVVSTTGNAYTWPLTFLLFFAHFSVNNTQIPRFDFINPIFWVLGRCVPLTPSLRRPYIHAILFSTACQTACKHAFCFLRVCRKPCQHATRGCDKRWMTCIHAGVSRSPREHASVPPDKRHCRQWMSEWNGMSEWIFA